MKSILISIKPRHCVNILNGDKKIEVRTTATKEWKDYLSGKTDVMPEPIECLIYCTKQNAKYYIKNKIYNSMINGKVIAKFTLNKVEEIPTRRFSVYTYPYTETLDDYDLLDKSCLYTDELENYLGNNIGYAWHIDNLVIFDKPKELSDFNRYHEKKDEYSACWTCKRFGTGCKSCKITKAPQSWQFVESKQ